MKAIQFVMLLGAATFAGACIDGDPGKGADTDTGESGLDTDTDTNTDTEDSDLPAGPPTWDWTDYATAVTLSCVGDGADGSLLIQLRTTNWGYTPELYVAGTQFTGGGAYDEEHTLAQTDFSDNDNGYSVFERELTAHETDNPTPDVSTLFRCDAFEEGGDSQDVTIAALVYDIDGNVADCIVFGQNPSALLNKSVNGLNYPAWLNSTDCHEPM